ncbi:GLPGLI family protein [Flavicella sediminum]|uniref:GLPGLI family protein n=1 Tax=Flavicella sediminum TaxID=2585141 RepID=UPI00112458FE|nr:GLPGLI family protein [Flavicella sediminum]
MKNCILLIITFSLTNAFAQKTKGIITYEVTLDSKQYLNNLEKNIKLNAFVKKVKIRDAKKSSSINFFLSFVGKEAIYKEEFDKSTKRRLGMKKNFTSTVARGDCTYYYNFETKEAYRNSFWTNQLNLKMSAVNWTLSQESKKIGNYICYKAIGVSSEIQEYEFIEPIIAWYAPEIPVPFGIANLNGLPGLTLELTTSFERGKLFYKATKIELNPSEEIIIKKPKGKVISEDAYIKMIQKMNSQRRKK